MEIIGHHNLNNPSFLRAVLETAQLLLKSSGKVSAKPYELACDVVDCLGLPSSEIVVVSNAIAPKFSPIATLEYIGKALSRLQDKGKTTTPNPIGVAYTSSQDIQRPRLEKQNALKLKILRLLQDKKVVSGRYLLKTFSEDFADGQFTIGYISQLFALNEACWQTAGETFVSLPGFDASKEGLAKQILQENGHKPFPINRLAERYGYSTQQTIALLKARKLGSLFLWSPYDVWSIADIPISEQRKERIYRFALSRHNGPILIDDAFDWAVSGLVARNLYSQIDDETKVCAIDKAFALSGVTNYQWNKKLRRYVSKEKTEKKTCTLEPLYKPLWEDE